MLCRIVGTLFIIMALGACGGEGPESETHRLPGDDPVADDVLANRDRDLLLPPEEKARKPVFGGIVTIRQRDDPHTLNNLMRRGGSAQDICLYLYPRLLHLDPDTLDLLPYTAAALPQASADRKVFTWKLRKNLKWHDFEETGALVTSRDVLFTFRLMREESAGAGHVAADFEHLTDIRIIDDYTFEAVYDEPCVDAIYRLGHQFRLMPAHLLEDVPPSEIDRHPIGRQPVGYGPFRFQHWKNNNEVLVVRDDRNREIFPERFRPYLDGIRWRTIPDSQMVLPQFLRGEIDICILSHDDWKYKTRDPAFEKLATRHLYYLPFWTYIAWNNRSPLFSDSRVRNAMTHMTRRQEVLESHIHGLGKVLSGPLFYYSKAYDQTIEPLPFDPSEAARLLAEAGWADTDGNGILDKEHEGNRLEFRFDFMISANRQDYMDALLTAMKEDLSKIGVLMEVREMEWSAFLERYNERQFDALTLGYRTWPVFEDPYTKWHSSQDCPGGYNRTGYKNAEVDDLLGRARLEFDDDKRYALLRAFHALINADQPFTCLYSLASTVAVNRRWRNMVVHQNGAFLYEWWLPPEGRNPSDVAPK